MEEQQVRSIVICKVCECELRTNGLPIPHYRYTPNSKIILDVCLNCIQEEYNKVKPKV